MKKWICTICSYEYDETLGDPDGGIAPGTKWEDIPEDWICPVCGAGKYDFEEKKITPKSASTAKTIVSDEDLRELSFGELSALCSNLSKGCAKQYRIQESDLFNQLAEFYKSKTGSFKENQLSDIASLIQQDLSTGYEQLNSAASAAKDRGSLRAFAWGEKVSKIISSLLSRYEKQQDILLEDNHVFVCDICGFIFVGKELPEVCPVCKVPNRKFTEIRKEVK
ncbi:MAG: rubredoxin [Spirochaetes bacterium]|nr:rubredoxin [Spirochaetota bacterium]